MHQGTSSVKRESGGFPKFFPALIRTGRHLGIDCGNVQLPKQADLLFYRGIAVAEIRQMSLRLQCNTRFRQLSLRQLHGINAELALIRILSDRFPIDL